MSKSEIVPKRQILPSIEGARRIMETIDEKDGPFLALALTIDCDGIGSNDPDLRQRTAKSWTTTELLNTMK